MTQERHDGRFLRAILRGTSHARADRVSRPDATCTPSASSPPSLAHDFFSRPALRNCLRPRSLPRLSSTSQGHKGEFGHEFREFEFRPDGKLRYANNTNYKKDPLIRREMYVDETVIGEIKRIVADSQILREDDREWPEGDKVGSQELEIVLGEDHASFTTAKISSLLDVQSSRSRRGAAIFYYLVQDLKCMVFSLINLHRSERKPSEPSDDATREAVEGAGDGGSG